MPMRSLEQIDLIEELILDGRRIPFTADRLVDEQEAMQVIDQLRDSIPKDLILARDMHKNNNKYIDQAKRESEKIIKMAELTRRNLLSRNEITREAQKQIEVLKIETKRKCKDMIDKAEKIRNKINEDNKYRTDKLERNYQEKQLKLIKELEDKGSIIQKDLIMQHNRIKKQLQEEYSKLNEEVNSLQIKKESITKEINKNIEHTKLLCNNRIEQTNIYCEKLVVKANKDSSYLSEEAYKYANLTLSKLFSTVKSIGTELQNGRDKLKIPKNKIHRKGNSEDQ